MSEQCKACGAPLIWALTKKGTRAPICAEPSPEGNVLIFQKSGTIQARTFGGMAIMELQAEGVPLRLNHFANCENAGDFR